MFSWFATSTRFKMFQIHLQPTKEISFLKCFTWKLKLSVNMILCSCNLNKFFVSAEIPMKRAETACWGLTNSLKNFYLENEVHSVYGDRYKIPSTVLTFPTLADVPIEHTQCCRFIDLKPEFLNFSGVQESTPGLLKSLTIRALVSD